LSITACTSFSAFCSNQPPGIRMQVSCAAAVGAR
jgi:hypothetical protein